MFIRCFFFWGGKWRLLNAKIANREGIDKHKSLVHIILLMIMPGNLF